MPYLNIEKKAFFKTLNCERFKDKISLLFLGTLRSHARIPFEERGGIELLEAFKILNKKYNNLELTIRAPVPTYIYNKYSQTLAEKMLKYSIKFCLRKNGNTL